MSLSIPVSRLADKATDLHSQIRQTGFATLDDAFDSDVLEALSEEIDRLHFMSSLKASLNALTTANVNDRNQTRFVKNKTVCDNLLAATTTTPTSRMLGLHQWVHYELSDSVWLSNDARSYSWSHRCFRKLLHTSSYTANENSGSGSATTHCRRVLSFWFSGLASDNEAASIFMPSISVAKSLSSLLRDATNNDDELIAQLIAMENQRKFTKLALSFEYIDSIRDAFGEHSNDAVSQHLKVCEQLRATFTPKINDALQKIEALLVANVKSTN